MPEHDIQITVSEHGFDPENGVRLTQSFMELYPDAGPAVSQNVRTGTLSVTFTVDADNAQSAFEAGAILFARSMMAAKLDPTQILSVESSIVGEAETGEREPVLA